MRKFVLLSTILFTTPFAMECKASNCATTDCQNLGYVESSNNGNCLQCPFGNYWFCPRTEEETCTPLPDEMFCQYGTTTGDDGCGGTRTICKECVPLPDDWWCPNGTTTASDGCGGTRTVCKECDNSCPSGYSLTKPSGCYDTKQTECGNTCYKSKQCCDNSCENDASKTCSSGAKTPNGTDGCGNTCYKCCFSYRDSETRYGGCYCEDAGNDRYGTRRYEYTTFYDSNGEETGNTERTPWTGHYFDSMSECSDFTTTSSTCNCPNCITTSSSTVCE